MMNKGYHSILYRYQTKGFEDPNLPPSGICIKVEKAPSGNSNRFGSHEIPNEFPCLLLVYDKGWNDYKQHTLFDVFFYQNQEKKALYR